MALLGGVCGEIKPANLDFLQDTATDLGLLIQNGLDCDKRTIDIKMDG